MIGPWNHSRPDSAVPGPTIDYRHEIVRWLDFHFKGRANGVDRDPPVQVYMQRYDTPHPDRLLTSGEWRGEMSWPPEDARQQALYLDAGGALQGQEGAASGFEEYSYNPAVGLAGGLWSGGVPYGLPTDQRLDEAWSLVYTSAPLTEEVAILGWPRAILHVSSTAEVMGFCASLCDVAPDGTSALVAKGMLNGTRRASLTDPSPLVPGEVYELQIEIDCTAWTFAPGHRIRLDIASADYPNVWPTPLPGANRVYHGAQHTSRLVLPVVPAISSTPAPQFLPSPVPQAPHRPRTDLSPWKITWDVLNNRVGLEMAQSGRSTLRPGLDVESEMQMRSYVSLRDPADVSITGRHRLRRITPEMDVDVHARMQARSTVDAFHLTIDLDVKIDGLSHFTRRWLKSVPRRLL
jgi:hypothetical protein